MSLERVPASAKGTVAGYVRRSSEMQSENYSRDAQIRGIAQYCQSLGLPAPLVYEDDELSARGEQIAHRPAFKKLLEDVEAGRVHIVIVHSLDRCAAPAVSTTMERRSKLTSGGISARIRTTYGKSRSLSCSEPSKSRKGWHR